MTGSDGKLCEKERGKVWKDYMERIMNEENYWDHNVEDVAEGPAVCISREEVLQVLHEMKTRKAPGPSEVSLELIAASGEVVQVMAEIFHRVLDRFGLPVELVLNTVVPIFKGKGDIRNCTYYRAVKILEHGMKVVEMVLEKSFIE